MILQVVDHRWREHLENMDYLREGVHLRAMAQKDPLVEYTSEGHRMFEELNLEIREEVVRTLFHAEIEVEEADQLQQAQARRRSTATGSRTRTSRSQARRRSRRGRRRRFALGGDGASVTAGALDAGGGSVMTQQRVTSDREKTSAATIRAGAAAARSSSAATAPRAAAAAFPSEPGEDALHAASSRPCADTRLGYHRPRDGRPEPSPAARPAAPGDRGPARLGP